MDIHENDIGKEKRVFLVTLPKNNIENMQICVGDGYEDDDNLRYNVYSINKNTCLTNLYIIGQLYIIIAC